MTSTIAPAVGHSGCSCKPPRRAAVSVVPPFGKGEGVEGEESVFLSCVRQREGPTDWWCRGIAQGFIVLHDEYSSGIHADEGIL